jgi:hypothetical protein
MKGIERKTPERSGRPSVKMRSIHSRMPSTSSRFTGVAKTSGRPITRNSATTMMRAAVLGPSFSRSVSAR